MTGRTPPAVFNSSPAPIDQDWVDAELIPFLQRVYPEERRTTMDWNRQVVFGRSNLHLLEHYEDFPFTIERLRLCLLNSELLTPAEMSKFIPVTEQGSQYCLRIFVRHAIVHGSYMLFSLGDNPSPEFPRAGHTSTRPSTASPAEAAPARATSVAVLEARNATLERELANLNMRVDQAERGRGGGRGNGRGRGRPSQPRGDFVGRSDRGGGFSQGPNVPPNMQHPPSQFPSNPPPGMYGYPTYQYGLEQAAVLRCRSSKSAFRVIKDKLHNVVADLQGVSKAKARHRLKVFQDVLSNHLQDLAQALTCLALTQKSSIQVRIPMKSILQRPYH
ncbi:hypothetical protein J4E81_001306 [Alternaria sp. BMP 2799]|nr:hypothetical protein J4E81_001306 [Alternaria sp. BMP 2799]